MTYICRYQLPDYHKYLTKEVEADSQAEAKRVFAADMPGARLVGTPQKKK